MRISSATHRKIANQAREAGISINAFVKKVLDDAVIQHSCEYNSHTGYSEGPLESTSLAEPDPAYGSFRTVTLRIPAADIKFATTLTRRMGWKDIS